MGIPLKSKLFKNKEFNHFRTKMFVRTVVLMLGAVVGTSIFYSLVIYRKFANGVVYLFQHILRMDYDAALELYRRTFRNHWSEIILLFTMAVFFLIFRIYLNWFTRYFDEINTGMNSLLKENGEDVSLSPELLPLERKMNTVKHTVEKQKQDILESEQRKNDLIMYLAHDLKTPLASAIGYLNLLRDEGQISEELRERYLSIALDKTERLEDLINEFFEIARFNLSDITLQYSRINLTRLLEQLVYEFKPILGAKNLNCRLHIAEDRMLRCDADKIQRVFDNLLRNAVNYSFEDTEIEITVEEQNGSFVIRFANHGDTVPQDKLERIFEQFYRLDAARGTGSGGAGLGLAIARQITALHGGTITATSENELTIFTVTLPAA